MKSVEYYLGLSYRYELERDEEGGFFARHPELPGCAADGESAEQAVSSLDEARELWIRGRHRMGLVIPEPPRELPSGKLLLRMPPTVHAGLIRLAEQEGVSLNLLINSALAEFIGKSEGVSCLRAATNELTSLIEQGRSLPAYGGMLGFPRQAILYPEPLAAGVSRRPIAAHPSQLPSSPFGGQPS